MKVHLVLHLRTWYHIDEQNCIENTNSHFPILNIRNDCQLFSIFICRFLASEGTREYNSLLNTTES